MEGPTTSNSHDSLCCSVCHKSFAQKFTLKRHLLTHDTGQLLVALDAPMLMPERTV